MDIKTCSTPDKQDPENETPAIDADAGQSGSVAESQTDFKKELLYVRAEFENYKKRMLRDQEQAVRFANEKFVKELMGIVDQFDRALEHAATIRQDAAESVRTLIGGVEMTSRELGQMLGRLGVEMIGVKGEGFDPSRHEAISQQEASGVGDGVVLAVLHRGCLLHGRLLQPAKVIVSREKKLES